MAQGCCSCHSIHACDERFSSILISIIFHFLIFPFIFYLLHFFPQFFHFLEGRSEPVHSAKKGMDSLDESYSHTGCEPNAYDFKETSVESYTELLTSPPVLSDKGFPEDVEYDDTALEDMPREAHRVHVYHSQQEGLSVGQSSSVSDRSEQPAVEIVAKSTDRTGQPVVERGQELNTEHAQIRTLLDRQKERILAECRAEIKKREFQADDDRRSVGKLGVFFISSRRSSLRSS